MLWVAGFEGDPTKHHEKKRKICHDEQQPTGKSYFTCSTSQSTRICKKWRVTVPENSEIHVEIGFSFLVHRRYVILENQRRKQNAEICRCVCSTLCVAVVHNIFFFVCQNKAERHRRRKYFGQSLFLISKEWDFLENWRKRWSSSKGIKNRDIIKLLT